MAEKVEIGKVALVGAIPGDPELLTLRGQRLLAQADAVIYDYLVDPRTLKHCRPGCRRICLGRHGGGRIMAQDEIHRLMIEGAQQGELVVRLKGGDACIFGRLAEEITALESAGIPYEVTPGVTSASAASATTGIPLTHRSHASCVAFVAGQQATDGADAPLDYEALARFPGTLAIYMGVTTAPIWTSELLRHGKSADTPVAIVRYASVPRQETRLTTLGELCRCLESPKVRPPAVILVGESVAARARDDWFGARPLIGQTIVVTRPAHQASSLADRLTELGARVLLQPAIEIGPPTDSGPLDAALARLSEFDWIAFSSANGVQATCQRLLASGRDLRAFAATKIACIGPATQDTLRQRGLIADLTPDEYRAESLAEALASHVQGKRVLLVRASRGRETLAEMLAAAGAAVEQAVAYESRDVTVADADVAAELAAGEVDWMTVTSSAIARSLHGLFGDDLARARLVAISPLTAGVLAEAGQPATAVADTYDAEGVVAAILQATAR
ncbi:MAG: uroporphyrinogen-III C-methyltransferase [Planctomycetales bacterium]|nr:uroporphyrinogen-III C-methyltransferase [Planctomycetales bacterium]